MWFVRDYEDEKVQRVLGIMALLTEAKIVAKSRDLYTFISFFFFLEKRTLF